jgi:hypothetical protein
MAHGMAQWWSLVKTVMNFRVTQKTGNFFVTSSTRSNFSGTILANIRTSVLYAFYSKSHFIHSFIHEWLYSPLLGPGLFFSFVIFLTQTVGLLGRVISPSQGRYLHTGQHRYRTNTHTNTHVSSGIRTHDPSVRAREDSSCLRPRGLCDRHSKSKGEIISR